MGLGVLFAISLAQSTPSPAPTDACSHEAVIDRGFLPHDFSVDTGTGQLAATILVVVRADGSVDKVSVNKSSGTLSFDMASLHAARQSSYRPKVVDCHAVEGTYLFNATYTPAYGLPPH
jgi:TonB family protein